MVQQHFEFKEIPPKQCVPRPCILHTIEQDNSLCYRYINPVYTYKRVPFIYRNYFCTPVRIRHLIECFGKSYDTLASGRITMYSISVMMFSFNKATQNARKDICDHWTKEVSQHFYMQYMWLLVQRGRWTLYDIIGLGVRVMVFNATFNNISVISWGSVLLVEETGVPGENHRPVTDKLDHICPLRSLPTRDIAVPRAVKGLMLRA